MPDLDLDQDADAQDAAETFDETHRDALEAGAVDLEDDPDIAEDVYDVTTAIGDADDDHEAIDAADFDDDEVGDEDLDDDDEEEEDFDDEDDPVDIIAGRAAPSEPGLAYVADVDPSTYPRDDEAEKYESTRRLSDAQLSDLGYLKPDRDEEVYAVIADAEDRSFGPDAAAPIGGSGATAEDVEDESDPDDEARLDEGLEETFPASDPVSADRIT